MYVQKLVRQTGLSTIPAHSNEVIGLRMRSQRLSRLGSLSCTGLKKGMLVLVQIHMQPRDLWERYRSPPCPAARGVRVDYATRHVRV